MYLSRLRIKNYKSIKELDLKFEKGKNVIVGKNNSGKSNIIKAIDIVLGEATPTYQKFENITENDFHLGNTDQPIYIFCELTRDSVEPLDFDEIYKCYGFKIHANVVQWQPKRQFNEERHVLSEDSEQFWDDLEVLMNITEDDVPTGYVDPKLRNQRSFEDQLEGKYHFAYAFRASRYPNGKIEKEMRVLYRESPNFGWVLAFRASIRNELLQSAIIRSFRDPQNELRLNQWSWYGKLLRNYIDTDNSELTDAFHQLKNASDTVFRDLETHLMSSNVKIAFPDTSISFQFNPDTKIDIYKSALIYVDDGFNTLLQDKGSGIQSAVIIGLFDFYTRHIAHNGSSLLAIEEPELYLHPQARRVISNRLDDFLDGNKNQVVISTHASEFLTSAHDNVNIIVVKKDKGKSTQACNTSFKTSKEKQILRKSQNVEMFFADKVILVEGGDKYILEAIARHSGKNIHTTLGENWLDDKNISLIAVGGKTEFWKYWKKLHELDIETFILADFDFFLRKLSDFLTKTNFDIGIVNALNGLKGKMGSQNVHLAKRILNEIQRFNDFLVNEGFDIDQKDIRSKLKERFRVKKLNQLESEFHSDIKAFLTELKSQKILILEKELEDYFTNKCRKLTRGIDGKEEKTIYIVSQLLNNGDDITGLIERDEFIAFLEIVKSTL